MQKWLNLSVPEPGWLLGRRLRHPVQRLRVRVWTRLDLELVGQGDLGLTVDFQWQEVELPPLLQGEPLAEHLLLLWLALPLLVGLLQVEVLRLPQVEVLWLPQAEPQFLNRPLPQVLPLQLRLGLSDLMLQVQVEEEGAVRAPPNPHQHSLRTISPHSPGNRSACHLAVAVLGKLYQQRLLLLLLIQSLPQQ